MGRGLVALAPSRSLMRAPHWNATLFATARASMPASTDLNTARRGWMMRMTDCGVSRTTTVGETRAYVPGGADVAAVLQVCPAAGFPSSHFLRG